MDTRTSTRNIVGDKRDASPPENKLLGKVDNEPLQCYFTSELVLVWGNLFRTLPVWTIMDKGSSITCVSDKPLLQLKTLFSGEQLACIFSWENSITVAGGRAINV